MTTVTISPLHGLYDSTAAAEQALQLFAQHKLQRHLSPTEITELSWLHYRHRIHGNARTTWRDYAARFGSVWSLNEKSCQNRWSCLRKLAIQIRMLEPWDFDSRRMAARAKRYLQFTQAFLNFPWPEVIGQAEAEAKAAAQLQPTDSAVAALLRWREGEFPGSGNAPASESENSLDPGMSTPWIREFEFPGSGNAPAENPCDNRAESDSLKTYKKPIQETLSTPSHSFKDSSVEAPAGSDLARLLEGEASTAERSPRSHGPTARAHLERSQPSSAPPEQPDQPIGVDGLIRQAAAGQRKRAQAEQSEQSELTTDYNLHAEDDRLFLLNPKPGMLLMYEYVDGPVRIESIEDGLVWVRCTKHEQGTLPLVDGAVELSGSGFRPLTKPEASSYNVETSDVVETHEQCAAVERV